MKKINKKNLLKLIQDTMLVIAFSICIFYLGTFLISGIKDNLKRYAYIDENNNLGVTNECGIYTDDGITYCAKKTKNATYLVPVKQYKEVK